MNSLKCNKILNISNNILFQKYLGGSLSQRKNQFSSQNSIKIPKAIPRGPTDILQTLSSTVNADYTGTNYAYIDDHYLIPISFNDRRSFLYSKEAGRKAARYFFEKYPQHFHRDISEPKVDAFTYRDVYDETMEFDVMDLEKCISSADVSNAIICYNGLLKQGVKIDPENINELLDLVCFYNSEDPPEPDLYKNIFGQKDKPARPIDNWKDDSFAEKLMNSFENPTSRNYCSIIQGLVKYGSLEKAFIFYRQAIDLDIKINVETYNSLISSLYYLHSSNDERWKNLLLMFKSMQKNGIKPNLETLNTSLRHVAEYNFWDSSFENAKKIYNEFAFKFGIIPTRETNSIMLSIFYKSKNAFD